MAHEGMGALGVVTELHTCQYLVSYGTVLDVRHINFRIVLIESVGRGVVGGGNISITQDEEFMFVFVCLA